MAKLKSRMIFTVFAFLSTSGRYVSREMLFRQISCLIIYNDTNVLAFGARVVGLDLALMIVDAWLSGVYEGGRHAKRVQMLADIENER